VAAARAKVAQLQVMRRRNVTDANLSTQVALPPFTPLGSRPGARTKCPVRKTGPPITSERLFGIARLGVLRFQRQFLFCARLATELDFTRS